MAAEKMVGVDLGKRFRRRLFAGIVDLSPRIVLEEGFTAVDEVGLGRLLGSVAERALHYCRLSVCHRAGADGRGGVADRPTARGGRLGSGCNGVGQ